MFNSFYISKANLLYNLNLIKKQSKAKVCAMVKANAYGVGLDYVVDILKDKVDFFGVANVQEADRVRKLTKNKILIVDPFEHTKIKDYSYSCCNIEDLKYLISTGKPVNVHIKINTGMNRFGFKLSQLKHALNLIKNSNLILEGMFTHFATADNFVEEQFKIFKKAISLVKKQGFNPIIHADNSANLAKHKLDMVRVGFKLYYGDSPFKPTTIIKAKILQCNSVLRGQLVGYDYNFVAPQKMKVAVVSVGYADGFLRGLIGFNLRVNRKECKVLNVCMDSFMLDITNTNLKKGDSIYLINKQNTLNNYANYLHTSAYEIGTNFSKIRTDIFVV